MQSLHELSASKVSISLSLVRVVGPPVGVLVPAAALHAAAGGAAGAAVAADAVLVAAAAGRGDRAPVEVAEGAADLGRARGLGGSGAGGGDGARTWKK